MGIPKNCPLCGADSNQLYVKTAHVYGALDHQSAFYGCKTCQVFFQFPGLSDDQQKFFYANEFEGFMSSRSGESGGWDSLQEHHHANRVNVHRRLRYLKQFLTKESMTILEVGCSSGFMIQALEDLGHDCYGIEPSGLFSRELKKQGFKVAESEENLVREYTLPNFDLVLHFFVLEHVQDPLMFLKSQIDLIGDEGLIIFEIPNSSDALVTVFDIPEFERFYWSVAHPWYFNEKSCSVLLKQLNCNFEVLLDQRYDLSNHFNWALNRCPGGSGKYTSMLGEELEKTYKDLLVKAGLCDTLIAVVRK